MGHAAEELRQLLEKMKGEMLPGAASSKVPAKTGLDAGKPGLPSAAAPAEKPASMTPIGKESGKQELIARYESALRRKEAEHEKEIRILRGEFEQERRLLWGEIDALETRTQQGEKRYSEDL
jgi:hypothetical protein